MRVADPSDLPVVRIVLRARAAVADRPQCPAVRQQALGDVAAGERPRACHGGHALAHLSKCTGLGWREDSGLVRGPVGRHSGGVAAGRRGERSFYERTGTSDNATRRMSILAVRTLWGGRGSPVMPELGESMYLNARASGCGRETVECAIRGSGWVWRRVCWRWRCILATTTSASVRWTPIQRCFCR